MKQWPLSVYVVSVVIVLFLGNFAAWLLGGLAKLQIMEVFSSGFLLGMLAMFIAVHVYKWRST